MGHGFFCSVARLLECLGAFKEVEIDVVLDLAQNLDESRERFAGAGLSGVGYPAMVTEGLERVKDVLHMNWGGEFGGGVEGSSGFLSGDGTLGFFWVFLGWKVMLFCRMAVESGT